MHVDGRSRQTILCADAKASSGSEAELLKITKTHLQFMVLARYSTCFNSRETELSDSHIVIDLRLV